MDSMPLPRRSSGLRAAVSPRGSRRREPRFQATAIPRQPATKAPTRRSIGPFRKSNKWRGSTARNAKRSAGCRPRWPKSIKNIKAGCGDGSSLAPLDRLTASLEELWAVRDSGIYIRAPLKAFYNSLSDAQKAGFEWKQPQGNSAQNSKAADSGMARQYQACAAPSLESSELMLKEIEEKVRPSKQQAASMQALRKTSAEMAKLLTASCAQPIPADPVARLNSANNQLSSMSYAATSLEIALDGFYAQLDHDQKARFDSLGR